MSTGIPKLDLNTGTSPHEKGEGEGVEKNGDGAINLSLWNTYGCVIPT